MIQASAVHLPERILACQYISIFVGYLQIRYLCCAIYETICLDNEDGENSLEFYSGLIPSCLCQSAGDSRCHILFVKSVNTGIYNHFVSLLLMRGECLIVLASASCSRVKSFPNFTFVLHLRGGGT